MPIKKVHWQEYPSAKITHCGQHFEKVHWSPEAERVTCKKCLTHIRRVRTGMVPDLRHLDDAPLGFKKKHVQGKTKKPKKDKVRINMDVEAKTKERLDNLVVMLEASGYTEVVRRALIFFEKEMEKSYGRPGDR